MNEAIDNSASEENSKIEDTDSDSLKLWKALHGAFDHLNDDLFEGELDRNRVILNCSRKSARTLGFYRPMGWRGGDQEQEKAEISLNPDSMHGRSIDEIYSTLAHEMAHFWQDCFGEPGKRGYHNKGWADKMELIGLMPFDIKDAKKKTGMRCSHNIIPGGVFDQSMEKMPKEYKLALTGISPPRGKAKTGYPKWSCPQCGQACRAKETADISCTPCTSLAFDSFQSRSASDFKMVKFELEGF